MSNSINKYMIFYPRQTMMNYPNKTVLEFGLIKKKLDFLEISIIKFSNNFKL